MLGHRTAALLAASVVLPGAVDCEVQRPNLWIIVADDYGWNDVGFHQNQRSSANPSGEPTTATPIATPRLDLLAKDGVRLEMYYVQPVCSPTRGSIMTGRYPSHTGIGPAVIPPTAPYGMPKEETLLPQVLGAAGYRTAALGKWHLGFCDERFTPTFRGFDEYLGYLNGAEDYWSHYRCQAPPGLPGGAGSGDSTDTTDPPNPRGIVCSGIAVTDAEARSPNVTAKWNFLDFRNGSTSGILAAAANNSFEDYSAFVFAREAVRMAENHKAKHADAPFFMYMAMQSVHEPLQAPDDAVAKYASMIADFDRRVTAAMVTSMDTAIGLAVDGWDKAGMWEDTVLVFTTDNGGPQPTHNNWPLRGGKFTNWEGGVRGNCFLRGTSSRLAKLQPSVVGTFATPLMHASDWLPTLAGLAGIAKPRTARPLDGFNQWRAINGLEDSPRKSVVHNVPTSGYEGAIRLGDFKLLLVSAPVGAHGGMQTVVSGIHSQRQPPQGFIPTIPDVFPSGVNITVNGPIVGKHDVVAWLFNSEVKVNLDFVIVVCYATSILKNEAVTEDPQELKNLAYVANDGVELLGEPSYDANFKACLKFYEDYRATAVADLTISKGDKDPAANPGLRADQTWGPFVNSSQCEW